MKELPIKELAMNENGLLTPNGAALVRSKPKVYIETSVFVALFGREDEKWKMARDILSDGREGRIEVVVSVLTMIECEVQTQQAGADLVADFFESEWIVRCNVDPFVAGTARRLRERVGSVSSLSANGWIHAATALWEGCNYLMSYDRRLLKLSGQNAMGDMQLIAPGRPWDAGQMSLADLEGVMPESSGDSLRRSLVI